MGQPSQVARTPRTAAAPGRRPAAGGRRADQP